MSLPAARTRAEAATKELKRTWQDLLTRWDDEVSRSMTKNGIEPIDQELSRTLEAFERMDALIRKAMSECREESSW